MPSNARLFRTAGLVVVLAAAVAGLGGANSGPIRKLSLDEDAPRIDVFEAIEQGKVDVRVTPRDEFYAIVSVTNLTDKPVTVVVPQAVAAVHVLKQFGPATSGQSPFGQSSSGQNDSQGNSQRVGGQVSPFGQQSGTANSSFFGNGSSFFSVPAEKTVQIQLHSVCLDHGKRGPTSRMTYALRKFEDIDQGEALGALFRSEDLKKVDRMTIQAAAWHLANGLSFPQLASLTTGIGVTRPLMTPAQIRAANELAESVKKQVGPTKPAALPVVRTR